MLQGANEAAVRMLKRIGTARNVPVFLEKVKRREVRLFPKSSEAGKFITAGAFAVAFIVCSLHLCISMHMYVVYLYT